MIYSGDSDPAVPIAGTLMWMNKIKAELSLSTRTYWRPWMTETTNGLQNSGSIWTLSNKLTLFRFKGVGHMAPQWNNQGGTKLVNYFLFDESPWSFNHHSFISFIFFNHITKNQTQTIIRVTLPFRHDLLQGSFLLANKQLKGEKSQNGEVDIRENEKKTKRIQRDLLMWSNVLTLDGEVIFSD